MRNTHIEQLYDYTLQQMAAESYFEGISLADHIKIKERLYLGTNREGYPPGAAPGNPALNEGYPGYTRMTELQAEEFLSKYAIVHQWSDNPTPTGVRPAAEGRADKAQLNDEILANTGLSVTLIQAKDANGNLTNRYTFALRSTEFRPWAAGGDGERDKTGADIASIAFKGFALAQLDALEQYYQWLKDNDKLPAGAALDITGYSLGGHLATVFTEIHQNDTDIAFGETVTFNGAGRGNWNTAAGSEKDMIAYYRQVLVHPELAPDPGGGIPTSLREAARGQAGQPFDPKNIYADPRYDWAMEATQIKFGLSFQSLSDENRTGTLADGRITQVFGFETINNTNFTANSGIHGPAVRVGIESQPLLEGPLNDFGNGHAITLLADSLALQRVLHQLDNTYTLDKFIALLPAASNRKPVNGAHANYEVDALENVLDPLRRLILGNSVPPTPFKEGASGFGDIAYRTDFHGNLKTLMDSDDLKQLAGNARIDSLVATEPVDLVIKANQADAEGLAYRYALAELNTFAVVGANYDPHNPHGELNRYNPASGAGQLTDAWLTDRANALRAFTAYNTADGTNNFLSAAGQPFGMLGNATITDLASGRHLTVDGLDLGIADKRYITFGGTAADTLTGDGAVDRLYGMAGDDSLEGKDGNDYLEGGQGFDTYRVGSGGDTLLDTDGMGAVYYNGDLLSGGAMVDIGRWVSNDGRYGYDLADNGYDLVVSARSGTGSTVIKDFLNGELGIALGGWSSRTRADTAYNRRDNVYGTAQDELILTHDRSDYVIADGGNDEVHAGADDDIVNGGHGNDVLYGDSGNDWLKGDLSLTVPGNDIIMGGAGNDLIDGGAGNDILHGNESATPLGETLVGRGDWMNGGEGDDYLFGSRQDDFMAGGTDADRLFGGGGNDVLLGDAEYRPDYGPLYSQLSSNALWIDGVFVYDWSRSGNTFSGTKARFILAPKAQANQWSVTTDASTGTMTFSPALARPATQFITEPAVGGGDMLYGGLGNDWIDGQAGNDLLEGEDGNDTLRGGLGDDRLDGGIGSDQMVGGADDDTYVVDVTGDRVVELANQGSDTVESGITYSLGEHLENLLLTGSAVIAGRGNALDNRIGANGGGNALDGGAGNDILTGGAGVDTYHFASSFHLGVDGGHDRVRLADGRDWIEWGLGIAANDVKVSSEGGNLILRLDERNSITVENFSGENALAGVRFADGAIWRAEDIAVLLASDNLIEGGSGDDALVTDGAELQSIVIRARGTLAAGVAPMMKVRLDDKLIGSAEVSSIGYADYTFVGALTPSQIARLDVAFVNDMMIGGEDRNLYVDSINFGDRLFRPVDQGAVYDRGSGAMAFDGSNVIAGQTGMYWNGALRFDLPADLAGSVKNDQIFGYNGDDTLNGGGGNDFLNGGAGNDLLIGAHGVDKLLGESGNDILSGGADADILRGGDGDDALFADAASSQRIVVRARGSVAANDGPNMTVRLDGVAIGSVTITDPHYADYEFTGDFQVGAASMLDIVFSNDAVIAGEDRNLFVESVQVGGTTLVPSNTTGYDLGIGAAAFDGNNTIAGQTGMYWNGALRFQLAADLFGSTGDDTLEGGVGNDSLNGGAGSDTYLFSRNDGADRISDTDSTLGNADRLAFGADIAAEQIWLRRVDNDLEVSLIGGNDKSTVTNWYAGNAHHVEQFTTTDGRMLLDNQVDALVSAMAAFAPPTAGQTSLPADYQIALAPVIAANWR